MEIFHYFCFVACLAFTFFTLVFAFDPYSNALVSLKSELVDDDDNLGDWLLPPGMNSSVEVHACSWSGIKCNKDSTVVIALDLSLKNLGGILSGKQFNVFTELVDLNLSYNSFSGQLPEQIFNLSNLRRLDISRNNFSGHFPGGVSGLQNLVLLDAFSNSFSGPLPVDVSKLEYLKVLNLAGSYFSGPIPAAYGSFKSMEFVHLAGNLLSGNIPPELGKLKTVTHMEIGYNSYQGTIPWQLGNMSQLEYLDMAGANISGTIPKQFSNLTRLQSLFLFRNQLSGLVPAELGRILPLTSLDLSDNQLTGPIPASFAELKNLRLLSLMYNEMSGTVPPGIASLPALETLLIWNNFFSGSLPEDLGRNSKLKWLDVSTNNLIGSIPPDICARGVLYKLMLFSNGFTGSLSPSISNCSSLVRLRIEDNSFSGDIPLKFNNLPGITYLDLSNNKFTGGIPSDLSQVSSLQYFNVSNNPGLGGVIPEQVLSLPLLQNFSASDCNISGNFPATGSCNSVMVIELRMNHLEGDLPQSISKCTSLTKVDLANNRFTGNIPEDLAGIPELTVLDLSHNNFTGSLPAKFGDSSRLTILNVSFNSISGSIPSNNLFKSMGSSAYKGNLNLCGAPLQPCPTLMAIFGGRGTGKLTWILLLCSGVIVFVVASALGIFYFRRGSKGQWNVISFSGIPKFTANDILKSLSSTESMAAVFPPSASAGIAVLSTGITVSVKKIELETKEMKKVTEFVTQIGNARHKNLIRLLGFCHNKHIGYLLYDYSSNGNLAEKTSMKRDWLAKYKLVVGIARGLCFLHHECHPAIPHGDLKSSNTLIDENIEPHLTEFGFKYLTGIAKGSSSETVSPRKADEFNTPMKEELYADIYRFGEIILEILTDGRLTNAGETMQRKPLDLILREVFSDNEAGSSSSIKKEMRLVVQVAICCTRSRPSERPSMEEAVKLLSGSKSQKYSKMMKPDHYCQTTD
ncbi:hypothetical protein K2173_020980 [Erythroxylum novogranatense]|uniref:Protein kinase domain-containing protein n=1 Tax=Erythroxylum novogranatense TaxID=1862640 RepID=A0AAV8TMA1_9ROSI|nr:hypothetical protein K2173_020980 [Erythroxylum novogranatense]